MSEHWRTISEDYVRSAMPRSRKANTRPDCCENPVLRPDFNPTGLGRVAGFQHLIRFPQLPAVAAQLHRRHHGQQAETARQTCLPWREFRAPRTVETIWETDR